MKNKFYYKLWILFISLCGFLTSCEDEGNVRDGIREVSFKATSETRLITEGDFITYIDSSLNVTSRTWTFSEGDIATSDAQTVDVTYPVGEQLNDQSQLPGYLTELEVTHDDGTVEKGKFIVGVYQKVKVDFEASEVEVIKGTSTNFTSIIENLPSIFEDNKEFDSIEWTFEGGNPETSTAENPTVFYNTTGTYKVTLFAHREGPLSETTKSVDAYITVVDPVPVVPEFSANEIEIDATSTVTFTDETAGAPDAWLWTFSGGTPATSTEQNPAIVYDVEGVYDVTLQATRTVDGATETITKTGYITVNPVCMPIDSNLVVCGNYDGETSDLSQWNAIFEDFATDKSANLSISNSIFAPGGGMGSIKYNYEEAPAPGFTDVNIDYLVEIDVTEAGSYTVSLDHYGEVKGGVEYVFNLGFVNVNNLGADNPSSRAFQGRFAADTWHTASATIDLPVGKYYARLSIFNPGYNPDQNIDLYMDNITVVKN